MCQSWLAMVRSRRAALSRLRPLHGRRLRVRPRFLTRGGAWTGSRGTTSTQSCVRRFVLVILTDTSFSLLNLCSCYHCAIHRPLRVPAAPFRHNAEPAQHLAARRRGAAGFPHHLSSSHLIIRSFIQSIQVFYDLQSVFGPGSTADAKLIGVAPSLSAAISPAFFASAAAAVSSVLAVSPAALLPANVSGFAWDSRAGAAANATAVAARLAAAGVCPPPSAASPAACRASGCSAQACSDALLASTTLSPDGRALVLHLSLRIDRNDPDGIAWCDRARTALDGANGADASGVVWRLSVDPSADTVGYIYNHLGTLFGVTAAVVFAVVALGFGSILISVRCLVTLAAMEVTVWGAATGICACRCS